MSKKDRDSYEYELKHYWTYWATLETAEKRGKAKGKVEGKAEGEAKKATEIAQKMKEKGLDAVLIAEMTDLSPEEIAALQ